MKKVIDGYSVMFDTVFGMQTETGELCEHNCLCNGCEHTAPLFWAISIWKNNVMPAKDTRPSQVHVGQEKYIKRLWRGYKGRRVKI